MEFDSRLLDRAFLLLEGRLRFSGSPITRLVVCGGSALITMGLVSRTTKDVDVVALADEEEQLISPVPFPQYLNDAIQEVAVVMGIDDNWLNNEPNRDSGGLFQTGLPEGLLGRAHMKGYGSKLVIYFINRIDQIYFKVFAAADSLGIHVDDLVVLEPTIEEMELAARWCMACDPSEGFRKIIVSMLEQLGYEDVAERI